MSHGWHLSVIALHALGRANWRENDMSLWFVFSELPFHIFPPVTQTTTAWILMTWDCLLSIHVPGMIFLERSWCLLTFLALSRHAFWSSRKKMDLYIQISEFRSRNANLGSHWNSFITLWNEMDSTYPGMNSDSMGLEVYPLWGTLFKQKNTKLWIQIGWVQNVYLFRNDAHGHIREVQCFGSEV